MSEPTRRKATPAEVREEIRRACYLLMEDDGFHEAMEILCPLAGLEFPAATVAPEPMSIQDATRIKPTGDCLGCWWQEGGRCYLEPVDRSPDGRSTKPATERCEHFTRSKLREMLEQWTEPAP